MPLPNKEGRKRMTQGFSSFLPIKKAFAESGGVFVTASQVFITVLGDRMAHGDRRKKYGSFPNLTPRSNSAHLGRVPSGVNSRSHE